MSSQSNKKINHVTGYDSVNETKHEEVSLVVVRMRRAGGVWHGGWGQSEAWGLVAHLLALRMRVGKKWGSIGKLWGKDRPYLTANMEMGTSVLQPKQMNLVSNLRQDFA